MLIVNIHGLLLWNTKYKLQLTMLFKKVWMSLIGNQKKKKNGWLKGADFITDLWNHGFKILM